MEFAEFKLLFDRIEAELEKRDRIVLALDGAAASGKTTLASYISKKYGADVIHMDDFFLPPYRKTAERLSEYDGNIDRERFIEEVLTNIRKAESFSYGRYDCSVGKITDRVQVGISRLIVVEGVYSLSHHFRDIYDIKVLLTVDEKTQMSRLSARSKPEILEKFKAVWLPLERRYFEIGDISSICDIVF